MKKEEKLELLLKIQNDPEQFTEEEIRQYHDLEARIGSSILRHLQPETAKES